MKILHVIYSLDSATGGPAEGVRNLCRVYKTFGYDASIATLDAPEIVQGMDFPAKIIPLGPGNGKFGYSRQAITWLRSNIKNYDVVIANGIWQYSLALTYGCVKKAETPFAVFTHGMLDPYFKKAYPLKHIKKLVYWYAILKNALRRADLVFFTCEEEKILARRSFPGYKANEAVTPYGTYGPACDLNEARNEFYERWPMLQGRRIALHMGRIHPKKGIDILIESFAKTLAADPTWHLVIAGPDQVGIQKNLEEQAERFGIADRITWTGMVQDALKWGAYAAAEVFVMPSHQENFGIVVAEALSCNLPVILSNKVNIWREVESYCAGIVNNDTTEGTIASLQRWMSLSKEEIAQMRLQSQRCFDEMFNYQTTANKIRDYIEYLVKCRVRPDSMHQTKTSEVEN